MLEVIKPGLETSVQDYPGRIGYWNQGFPPSGPMDSWSFRLANVLVGNQPGAAGLECQFVGPTFKFQRAGVEVPTNYWFTFAAQKGAMSFAQTSLEPLASQLADSRK